MITKSKILSIALAMALFVGCSSTPNVAASSISSESLASEAASSVSSKVEESSSLGEKPVVNVGSLKGPSSLGMLEMMDKNEQKLSANSYNFVVAGAPTDIQAKLLNGEVDIAAVPINMAAALYNKTDKKITTIAIGTLGVLYLLTNGEEISSFADLEGKTIYATGQGSTPEYVLNYLIEQNGLAGKVKVEYKAEHAELAALMASGEVSIAMLPQPFVTTVTSKNDKVKVALDLNKQWREIAGTELAMTAFVARNEFLSENKEAVSSFLKEYKASTEYVNSNVEEAAKLSEKFDIIPSAVAAKAIPNCGIVYIDGDNMKTSANPVLKVLFDANPQSVGGSLPDDAFYFKG